MTDYAFFRGRLTGAMVADSTDTSPSPEQGAIASVITEESDVPWSGGSPGSNVITTLARIVFPSGAPCPLYAAYLHFFGTIAPPGTIPVPVGQQPLVTVRRDVTAADGSAAQQVIIIEPPRAALATGNWDVSGKVTYAGDYVSLDFWDSDVGDQAGALGFFAGWLSPFNYDVIQPSSQIAILDRLPVGLLGRTAPSGYLYAWIIAPLGAGNTCICQITGGGPGVGPYTANFFANGQANAATETGASVTALQLDGSDTLDTTSWHIATRVGGIWYIQPPIFYA